MSQGPDTAAQTPPPNTDRADLRPESIQDAVIRLAGNSQDGIQTAGAFLARLAGRSEQDVMTYMTIPATISGGPSIFQVRIGSGEVLSAGDEADFLVAFYQHSYQDHIGFLREGGVLLYDSDNVEPNLDDKRFVYVGVPITGLTVEALGGTAKDKGKNIFVLGLISKIFNLDVEKLKRLISEKFAGKDESIVNTALMAFQAGYAYPVGNVLTKHYRFEHIPRASGRAQITMDGNQALAYGLIAARRALRRRLSDHAVVVRHGNFAARAAEIRRHLRAGRGRAGAVSIALGCSYSGYLAVTGSAGPGISLKTEAIGWASMAEIPLIICNVQRGGPSTGLPTNVEQSDLHQAIFGSHGDSPRVVLAAATVEDCFYIAIEAARIARKYSTPVFILSDTSLATRIEAFDEPDLSKLMVDPKPDLTPRQTHQALSDRSNHAARRARHAHSRRKISAPRRTRARRDGSSDRQPEVAHGDDGEAPQQIAQARRGNSGAGSLRRSGRRHAARRLGFNLRPDPRRGRHWRANRAKKSARCICAISIRCRTGSRKSSQKFKRIVVVEMNDQGVYGFGQLATILRARYCEPKIKSFTKTDGLTFRVKEILDGVFKGKSFACAIHPARRRRRAASWTLRQKM